MTNKVLSALIILSLFTGVDCKDDPPVVPPQPKLSLTLLSAEQRRVQVKLLTTSSPIDCIVKRDTLILFNSKLMQQEILLIDTTVFPGEQYTYKAYLFNIADQDTAIVHVTTPEPDSTLHEFVWTIDTLGTWQSVATDVWGTSPDNVYVSGFFYSDSLTPDSILTGTNIMRWDGKKWKLENFWEGDMYAIYGFSENDIWAGGDNGVNIIIGHWNGQKWNKTELGKGQITGLWGTSSKNLFATLGSGKILHYDGNTWTQMETATNIFLSDIWGFSENAIYACGYNDGDGTGVLLFFDGVTWNKLYERNYTTPIEPYGNTTTIWGYDTSHVYIYTPYGRYVGNKNGWNKIPVPNDNVRIQSFRGYSYKSIFGVGGYGLIIHWNGKSFYRYDQFFRYQQGTGDNFFGSWVSKRNVFIVGRSEDARGIVYRGKQ